MVANPEHAYRGDGMWTESWIDEPEELAELDPLYREALQSPEAFYIEDVQRSALGLLNLDYEREHYGHRALIHAPI